MKKKQKNKKNRFHGGWERFFYCDFFIVLLGFYMSPKKNINITRLFTVPSSSTQMQFFRFQSMYLLSCVCPSVLGFRSPLFVGGVGIYRRLFSSNKQRNGGGELYMKKKSNDGNHGGSHGGGHGKLSLDFGLDFSGSNGGLGVGLSNRGGLGSGAGADNSAAAVRNIAPQYTPKTINQELYMKFLNDPKYQIVFGTGPAGCGKTLFACITAVQELMSGNVKKIILTRPIVPVEKEEIGFLPGNLINKMDPWTRPIFDIFLEFYQQRDLDLMLHSGIIEISPLAYMRGRTFKRCFVIADEMQNSSPNQMMMLATRMGERSKLVITGDLKQTDRDQLNGLSDIVQRIHAYDKKFNDSMIKVVEMNHADVLRSPVVVQILDMYNDNIIGEMDDGSKSNLASGSECGLEI